jgi:hypothetical protein
VNSIENGDPYMEVFIRDNTTMKTYNIVNDHFEIKLDEGEYNDNYSVVFKPYVEVSDEIAIPVEQEIDYLFENVRVFVNNSAKELCIRKPDALHVKSVHLFNLIGQQIEVWHSGLRGNVIDLPTRVEMGVYLIHVETDRGRISRKVIVK